MRNRTKSFSFYRYVKESGGIQKLVALTRPTSSYSEEEDSKEPRTYSKKINAEANKVKYQVFCCFVLIHDK